MGKGDVSNGVLHLSGPLTFDTVGVHFRQSTAWLDGAETVTSVDLAQVERVDSAGLALLLEWQSQAKQRGTELEFHNAPRDLLRLASLSEATGLLGLMPVPEFTHEALG